MENQGTQNMENQGTTAKRSLGIKKDIQSKAIIPIGAPVELEKRTEQYPNGIEFPIAHLVKVAYDPAKEIKRQAGTEQVPVLTFVFVSGTGKQLTHVVFPVDYDDDKFDSKLEELQQGVKHIYDEAVGASHFVEGSMDGESFEELFDNIAKAFNAPTFTKGEGESAKQYPLYTNMPLYIKATYYKNRLGLPKYPNFVQAASKQGKFVPCELLINPKYDKIKQEAEAPAYTPAPAYGGGATFGANDGFPDYPTM